MIPREVKGPEANTERAGPQLTRDIRPGSVRFLQALQTPLSGFLLIAGGVGSFFVPVILDPVLVISIIIAAYVLTRPTILPMRLPSYARGRDRNHPSPRDRSAQKPAGIFYLGADFRTGQQIWLTNEDCRQHGVVRARPARARPTPWSAWSRIPSSMAAASSSSTARRITACTPCSIPRPAVSTARMTWWR
jgi:intracellular multiplication protein IcmO